MTIIKKGALAAYEEFLADVEADADEMGSWAEDADAFYAERETVYNDVTAQADEESWTADQWRDMLLAKGFDELELHAGYRERKLLDEAKAWDDFHEPNSYPSFKPSNSDFDDFVELSEWDWW